MPCKEKEQAVSAVCSFSEGLPARQMLKGLLLPPFPPTIIRMKTPYHPPIDSIPFTKVLHALSEPNRIKIVRCLSESGQNNCTAYTMKLMLPKSTVSHHIKVLREAGLIQARIEGKEHIYSLRHEEIDEKFPGLLRTVTAIKEEDI
jgi:DNA-binding transcriptional ArsR family regulator